MSRLNTEYQMVCDLELFAELRMPFVIDKDL